MDILPMLKFGIAGMLQHAMLVDERIFCLYG